MEKLAICCEGWYNYVEVLNESVGERGVNIRKWFYLFWTTLAVGAGASLLTFFYLQLTDPELKLLDPSLLIFNFGIGLMFSVLSQMGFFAYLTLNFIAKGIFPRKIYWTTIQWIIVVIVFFDLIYLRYSNFTENNQGILGYSILPVVLLILSILIAIWKSKLTNATAFTPTVFFLFVVTSIELIPALRENSVDTTLLMVVPLFCCNVWQILKLHTILQDKNSVTETAS